MFDYPAATLQKLDIGDRRHSGCDITSDLLSVKSISQFNRFSKKAVQFCLWAVLQIFWAFKASVKLRAVAPEGRRVKTDRWLGFTCQQPSIQRA